MLPKGQECASSCNGCKLQLTLLLDISDQMMLPC